MTSDIGRECSDTLSNWILADSSRFFGDLNAEQSECSLCRTESLLSVLKPNSLYGESSDSILEGGCADKQKKEALATTEHPNAEEKPTNDKGPISDNQFRAKSGGSPQQNKTASQKQAKPKTCCCTGYVYNPKEESYNWPSISEFRPEAIPVLLKKYVECWKLDPIFKFHLAPLGIKKSNYSTVYGAEVIFSAPTPSCPNPQFNVSVYFNFEVSKVTPKTLPVHVSYHFEGQRQVHTADNRFTFQEGVLILLMKCKMKIFSELRF